MRLVLSVIFLFVNTCCFSQSKEYYKSIDKYRQDYITNHEVVMGENRANLQFYPIDKRFCITARFEKVLNAPWFTMPTSSGKTKVFRVYGKVFFKIAGKQFILNLYQSQALMQKPEYWDNLFLPFMDATNDTATYEGGRYIDLKFSDIKNGKLTIDFNKAYNPYCAYVSDKYNCPIPPSENKLVTAISAGEKLYRKNH